MLDRYLTLFRLITSLTFVLILAFCVCPLESADSEPSLNLGEAFKGGKFDLDLRYRYEWVEDDDYDDDGLASTLRTVLNYRSLSWKGLAVFVEMENVTDIGLGTSHDDAGRGDRGNEVTDRPVIADPSGTAVNQGYLDMTFIPKSSIKVGRQEVNLGNVRFVGNVGWRQHHQSFDAARLSTKAIPKTNLTYAYVDTVNRIFGDSQKMSTHLVEADVTIGNIGKIRGYSFLLDYENESLYGLSTSTLGVRFDGGYQFGSLFKGLWDLEYAQQQDYGSNPLNVDADYMRLQLGAVVGGWTFKVAQEVLEGDPIAGKFTTPLATLHAWNGWADQFLATPVNGLEDTWLLVSTKLGDVAVTGVYHSFAANTGDADYGSEIDLHVVYVSSWKQKFGLKLAAYDADEYSRDVTKAMLWTSWGF